MKTLACLAVLASVLAAPAAALAQDPVAPPLPRAAAPVASPPAALPPAGPALSDEAPPPQVITVTVPPCRLAEHAGIDDADAHTAGRLVCDALAHAGASPNARYRVSLGKLGSAVILSIAQEGPTVGSTVDAREMRLSGIEEVEVAAPRLADSIVKGVPLDETAKVDNIVGSEARQPKTRSGKAHFGLGLLGMSPPVDQSIAPSPGMILDLHYETGNQRLEIGGSFRFGVGPGGTTQPSASSAIFSMGARYYLSDADVSPYFGGGLSWEYLSLSIPDQELDANNSGLGAYVDAGFEVLRTHSTHLAVGVRLDLPFFALNNSQSSSAACGYDTVSCTAATSPSTYYYAPLSLEMRLTF